MPIVDGPSEPDTSYRMREKDRNRQKKNKKKKWNGKNGKSVILPVGLHRTVSYYSLGEKCIL